MGSSNVTIPLIYFLTFNTHLRRPLLATEQVHRSFLDFTAKGQDEGIHVGRYVIMPDHVHLFLSLNFETRPGQWMRLLKRSLSKAIPGPAPHWQKGFFDHVIRRRESYVQKWEYVRQNPVRAGLITTPEEWPWQGELNHLD